MNNYGKFSEIKTKFVTYSDFWNKYFPTMEISWITRLMLYLKTSRNTSTRLFLRFSNSLEHNTKTLTELKREKTCEILRYYQITTQLLFCKIKCHVRQSKQNEILIWKLKFEFDLIIDLIVQEISGRAEKGRKGSKRQESLPPVLLADGFTKVPPWFHQRFHMITWHLKRKEMDLWWTNHILFTTHRMEIVAHDWLLWLITCHVSPISNHWLDSEFLFSQFQNWP